MVAERRAVRPPPPRGRDGLDYGRCTVVVLVLLEKEQVSEMIEWQAKEERVRVDGNPI